MSWRARPAIRDGIVLGAAVGVFGAAFGVLASTSGLTVAQACAMSLLVFTGASQFAAVTVVGDGGSGGAAVASALLLAARNAAYGVSIARLLPRRRLHRALAAQLVIDESTGMALLHDGDVDARAAFWSTGISIYVFWNLGTLAGAVGGTAIGDPEALGLDAAFPAGFIAFVLPHVRERPGLVAALVGGAVSVLAIPFLPVGVPILLGSLGAFVGAASARRGPAS